VSKIVNKAELLRRTRAAKAVGKTVVHCHGCFDMVHPGHVRYLEFAARQGDLLVVSLTGDSQIVKGDQRPYIPEELRAENLAALAAVSLVTINRHPTACELLSEMRPDIYVKGREYEHNSDPGFAAERDIVAGYGGRVLFSSGDVVFSSSRLIETMEQDLTLENERLTLFNRRHAIDRANIDRLLGAFSDLNVLVIGDLVLDRYVLCDATDLASEAPMMSLTQQEERVYVGGAGIVAQHVAGLGAKVYLLSAIANDETSQQTERTLARAGVRPFLIQCRSEMPQKTRYLVDTSKLLRVDRGESHPLDSVAGQQAADWVASQSVPFDAVIFCDLGYGVITRGLLDRLYELWRHPQPILAASVAGPRANLLQFSRIDLLCPTERQLRSSLHDFGRGLASVAWDAMDRTQARHMLVTLGKKGLVTFDRQSQDDRSPEWRGRLRSEYLPALARHTIDPLGCGDALLTAATLAMATGGSLMQAAYVGSAAAAVAIERLGNVPIDLETLLGWLHQRVELTPSAQAQPRKPVRFKVTGRDDPGLSRPLFRQPVIPTAHEL
jgi:rfaE bifunctional protein kinase chain/domain/rfaE bifunctional protein nucleotidyltransferase chain/domain